MPASTLELRLTIERIVSKIYTPPKKFLSIFYFKLNFTKKFYERNFTEKPYLGSVYVFLNTVFSTPSVYQKMIAFAIAVSISHTSSFYCPLFVSKELVYEQASQGDISLLSA